MANIIKFKNSVDEKTNFQINIMKTIYNDIINKNLILDDIKQGIIVTFILPRIRQDNGTIECGFDIKLNNNHIDILNGKGIPFESIEIKYEKLITAQMILNIQNQLM